MTDLKGINRKKLFWATSGVVFLLIFFFYEVPADYFAVKVMFLLATPFIVLITYTVIGIIGVIVLTFAKIIRDWLFR